MTPGMEPQLPIYKDQVLRILEEKKYVDRRKVSLREGLFYQIYLSAVSILISVMIHKDKDSAKKSFDFGFH